MENFDSMTLPESLMHTLKSMQFTKPTPIQAESIPHALAGKDVLGSAQTGTGKTAAFGIPLVSWLHSNNDGTSLILTPTRELAVQVRATLNQLLGKSGEIKTALLIGGESMGKQLGQLQGRPRVIVGTPGRINDHIERKSLKLHNVGFFVLDEIDRMLDIGLGLQVDRIVKFLPRERQTLMFSATLPEDIIGLSQKYLINPVRVAVGSTTKPIANIKQETIQVQESEKYDKLISELDQRQGSIIIFVKTKYGAEKLAIKLCKENHSADAMHGDLRQNKRDKVIQAFRNQKYRIMVATDIAARGLDIPHIEHVINYDLPQCPEDYIHRIGRTARAGAEGFAVNLIAPGDGAKWRAIHNLLNPGDKLPYMAAGKTASRSGARPQRGPSRSYNSGNKPAGSSYGEERRNNGGNSDRRSGSESRSYGDASGFNTERRRSGPRPDSRFGAPSGSGRGGNTRFGNAGSESGAGFDGERRRSGPSEGGAGGFGGERRRSSPSDKGAGGYNGGGERRRSGSSEGGAGGFGGERRRSASSGDTRFGAPASRSGAPSRSGGRPGGNSSAPRGGAGRSTGGAPRQGFSGPGRTGGSGQVA